MPRGSFRLQAKNIFLTYPQCALTKEALLEHLQRVLRFMEWAIVAEEQHEDGSPHLHAVIGCSKKVDIANERFFDFENYHPSIEGCRDVQASIRYGVKDGNFITFGSVPAIKRKWSEALTASSRSDAESILKSVSPRDWIVQHDRLISWLDKTFTQERPAYEPLFTSFSPCEELVAWCAQRLGSDRPKSLILWGPSRMGKTEWARSLGRHMYWNAYFDLSLWDDSAEYAVIDDIGVEHFARLYKALLGAQRTFTITDKYRPKLTVTWGKPVIWLSNQMPIFPDMAWIRVNCTIVEIKNPLFSYLPDHT